MQQEKTWLPILESRQCLGLITKARAAGTPLASLPCPLKSLHPRQPPPGRLATAKTSGCPRWATAASKAPLALHLKGGIAGVWVGPTTAWSGQQCQRGRVGHCVTGQGHQNVCRSGLGCRIHLPAVHP